MIVIASKGLLHHYCALETPLPHSPPIRRCYLTAEWTGLFFYKKLACVLPAGGLHGSCVSDLLCTNDTLLVRSGPCYPFCWGLGVSSPQLGGVSENILIVPLPKMTAAESCDSQMSRL